MSQNIQNEDQLLIQKINEGNKEAFEQLFKKYWKKLFAVAINRLQSETLAEDMIQELFTDLWSRRASLEINTSVAAYLYTALKYLIIRHIKKSSRTDKYVDMIMRQYEINDLSTENQVQYQQLSDELDRQVEALPARCRQVFKMSRYEQLTHKEIADKLNISYKTVENHINRALQTLRPSLEKVVSILLILWILI